ncbi:S1 family peptidase [Ramlibacter sp. PS4R-6]|uniref:S1 family peptidase n=1 Tax=Ramlibacter sp. PS4R-6 TaxID=3133438 RepID=UPI0030A7077A
MTEPLLLTATRVSTFRGRQSLTAATAFFFARGERLFAVTSRHVLHDEVTGHFPDRIELVLHTDETNLTRRVVFSILLYRDGSAIWRQGRDSAGPVDIAVIEIDRANLPQGVVLRAFEPRHIQAPTPEVEVGASLRVVGFPLGFYDTLHHLPVVRHAIIASAFGVRFQGQGYFLTDGRMHRGSSGAPVVMRCEGDEAEMPWRLLGVHAARLDMGDRDLVRDETLGLNCTWYADILMALTDDGAPLSEAEMGPRPGPQRVAAKPA